jgi:transposase-like protein
MHEDSKGLPAVCPVCGKKLAAREIRGKVLRELCPSCQAKSARIKHGKIEKGKQP